MEIAICDDNALFLRDMREQLKTFPMVTAIEVYSDIDEFMLSISAGKRFDAVFMDIEWEANVAGIDAAAQLYKLSPETKVIFVTGHTQQYSQQIFLQRANLSGYLTKPVDRALLEANLQKVAQSEPQPDEPMLTLKQKGTPISIPLQEIYYIESDKHTINVHTEAEMVTAYERLETIRKTLPAGFCHCHKSYIVNMSRIRRFLPGEILLKNGSRIPVSRSRYNETKEAYVRYIGRTF